LDILEHLPNPISTLQEARRVLRPGGWAAITLPNRDTAWKRRYRHAGLPWMSDRTHVREFTWAEIMDLLREGGFRLRQGPGTITYDTPLAGLFDFIGGFSLPAYKMLKDWKRRKVVEYPAETTGWCCVATTPLFH